MLLDFARVRATCHVSGQPCTCCPGRIGAAAVAAIGHCGAGLPLGKDAAGGCTDASDSLLFSCGWSRGFLRAVAGDLPRMLRFNAARTARLRDADAYSSLPASPDVSDIARPPDDAARPHEDGSAGGSGSRGRRAHCSACAAARLARITREQPSQVCSSSGVVFLLH